MDRLNIINSLCAKINAKKYLEIGVFEGYVFDNVVCKYKVGVDPDPNSKATIVKTSDDFFANNNETFDVIFIDGLHHADQVKKDIINAIKFLNNGGYIVCHDMLPPDENTQKVPQMSWVWTGDCWKAWVQLRSEYDNLDMRVVDTDYGCGIIRIGTQEKIRLECDLTWNNFVVNRSYWMNIISIDEFHAHYL